MHIKFGDYHTGKVHATIQVYNMHDVQKDVHEILRFEIHKTVIGITITRSYFRSSNSIKNVINAFYNSDFRPEKIYHYPYKLRSGLSRAGLC